MNYLRLLAVTALATSFVASAAEVTRKPYVVNLGAKEARPATGHGYKQPPPPDKTRVQALPYVVNLSPSEGGTTIRHKPQPTDTSMEGWNPWRLDR